MWAADVDGKCGDKKCSTQHRPIVEDARH
jgi:hypothetical protein